jgi:hypothetical protein
MIEFSRKRNCRYYYPGYAYREPFADYRNADAPNFSTGTTAGALPMSVDTSIDGSMLVVDLAR